MHTFDFIFYCEQTSHFLVSKTLVDHLLSRNPDLSILILFGFKKSSLFSYSGDYNVIWNISSRALDVFRSKVFFSQCVGLHSHNFPREAKSVHLLVSLCSLDGVYKYNMFDGYDYVICAGPHHLDDFRRWSVNNSSLKHKVLIPGGYPKLDLTISKLDLSSKSSSLPTTVIYAPTHVYDVNEKLASLRTCGFQIIDKLLTCGYKVIFRPHPVSLLDSDKNLVERILHNFSPNKDFAFDNSTDYFETYKNSDVMVTDLSGTGFTFSLGFLKPSIFISTFPDAEIGLTGIQFTDRSSIGSVLLDVDQIDAEIKNLMNADLSTKIMNYRENNVFNLTSSVSYISTSLMNLSYSRESTDWTVL